MKKLSTLLTLCLWVVCVCGQTSHTNRFKTEVGNTLIEVTFYNDSVVRVIKSPKAVSYKKTSLSVVGQPQQVKITQSSDDNGITLKSKSLIVSIDKRDGVIAYKTKSNKALVREKYADKQFVEFDDAGSATYSIYQPFTLDPEEAIYGLGQLQNGKMVQRNMTKNLVQGNVEDVTPFFQSTKGYGIFWDNYSPTLFVDNHEETSFRSDVGDCIDYYFMYGGSADGVISQMRYLTGQVPMFPLWTYGYWQSKERYKSQQETVDVVKRYRELGVPLDGIIQDWQYWGSNYLWNAMDFQNPNFADPAQMIADIHNLNAHVIISIWSSFGPMTKPYRELNKEGMLFDFATWPQSGLDTWPPNMEYPSGVRVYDAYNPKARDIYWKHLNEGIFRHGMDGWWMDSTEPDHLDFKPSDFDTPTYLGSFRKVRNAYPLMTVGGVYDNQRAVSSDKRVFILTRSGFAGQQRYGSNVWTGDVSSTWESLRNQIPAGLNFSLCGMPHWNSDIGGFFAGHYNKSWNDGSATKNPQFQELYVRWLQFGAFTPMMRSHGTDTPREIYHFGEQGEPVYDAIERTINLRYSLLPYIYSTSWEVTNNQSSFMRALMMDFVEDKRVWDINNQYMFGKSILVAPIVNAQYTPEKVVNVSENDGWNRVNTKSQDSETVDFMASKKSKVYLPEGVVWYDFYTNDKYSGGQEIDIHTTLDMIPLYVKAGSVIPIGAKSQYATEQDWSSLELRIYPAADGQFVLYEDEFDNYNYESGAYTEIPMIWSDRDKTLTIGKRVGAYQGSLNTRVFRIVNVAGDVKEVTYKGQEVKVRFR